MEIHPYRPKDPRYYRRANWHNYQEPCIYMLTFQKNPLIPPFCSISGAPNKPVITMNLGGKAIESAFTMFQQKTPHISILRYVVMPDHVHLIMYVTKPLQQPFGTVVAAIKGSCSQALWRLCSGSDIAHQKVSIFERHFHDRIVTRRGQLDTLTNYILDNPRRYLIKLRYPDLFIKRHVITIADKQYCVYGNIFLLRAVEKDLVVVRSHFSPIEREECSRRWLSEAENGGVLVSPFISGAERAIRNAALEVGGNVIEILDNGLPERYKPAGKAFDYCANGQLLYIAPTEYSMERLPMTREKAWQMNNLAKTICEIGESTRLLVR
jgi:REP element-mobilizing transposase RayT